MPTEPGRTLGILLISGGHERAHYAFILATSAAAAGRDVLLFATNQGVRALATDWSQLADAGRDAAVRARGVAGLGELREAAVALGVRLLVCQAGLLIAAMPEADLLPGVAVVGAASFLSDTISGQLLSL